MVTFDHKRQNQTYSMLQTGVEVSIKGIWFLRYKSDVGRCCITTHMVTIRPLRKENMVSKNPISREGEVGDGGFEGGKGGRSTKPNVIALLFNKKRCAYYIL